MVSNDGILELRNFQVTPTHNWDHDISHRQQSFLDLQKINIALESKVQELLAELSTAKDQLCRDQALDQQIETELQKSLSLLQATLDSTADGIIAISCKGDILTCNQKFFQMWQIPDSMMMSQNPNQYVTFYKDQLKDPEIFCGRIQELDGQLDFRDYDILEFKDGKFFEQYCQPLRLGEQIIGTVWSFREITKQKQTEEEIRFALKQQKQLVDVCERMNLRADDYFTKPSTVEELLEAIAALLEKQADVKEYYTAQKEQVSPSPETMKLQNLQSIFPSDFHLTQVFEYIEANYHQPISLQDVAVAVGYCPAYLTDLVHRQTGQTVNHWIIKRRMVAARSLLLEGNLCVNQIAEAIGYQHEGHFFRQFRQYHQTTPQAWRKAQRTELNSNK
ncbi:MAG: helix-turn-helix domain-containing protein [Nostoc sp.]|uniref:helix-turn-helix domain-containing protein n=1 Tax=Nostoc sp. TaxID=1180 RepID=UPI002FF457E4